MEIQDRIKELRKKNNWTQSHLSKLLKIQTPNLSRYESGKFQPTIPILKKFAKIFNVSIDYLIGEDTTSSKMLKIDDEEFYNKLKKIENLPIKDKEALKIILDGLLIKNQIKGISEAI